MVEKMNESTADSLGLSRAVLVNGKECRVLFLLKAPTLIVYYNYLKSTHDYTISNLKYMYQHVLYEVAVCIIKVYYCTSACR